MLWKEGRAGWFPPDQTSGLWLTWLGEYPGAPSQFQHVGSPSREQLRSEGIHGSQPSASPAYLWTISFHHLSSSYFLTVRVFLNLNVHFHSEVSRLIILSPPIGPTCCSQFPPSPSHSHPVPTATFHAMCHYCPLPHDCIGKSADPGILG